MLRAIVLLFWLSLLVGSLLARNLVVNWALALAGFYFLSRWWSRRTRSRASARLSRQQPVLTSAARPHGADSSTAEPMRADGVQRSRWTVDRIQGTDKLGRWR